MASRDAMVNSQGSEGMSGWADLDLLSLQEKRSEVSGRIKQVAEEIAAIAWQMAGTAGLSAAPSRIPVVPVHGSVTPESIACLFDGVRTSNLEAHVREKHGMSPEEYRSHFMLPPSYPMRVAAEAREVRKAPSKPTSPSHQPYKPKKAPDRGATGTALEGIDYKSAVLKALARFSDPVTTRQIAEQVMKDARRKPDHRAMMWVADRFSSTLQFLHADGLVEKAGDNYRRTWKLRAKTRRELRSRLGEELLTGIDLKAAIKDALAGAVDYLTTRQVAERLLKSAGKKADGLALEGVSAKLATRLFHMAEQGKVTKIEVDGLNSWKPVDG